jgi:hypothetical protein
MYVIVSYDYLFMYIPHSDGSILMLLCVLLWLFAKLDWLFPLFPLEAVVTWHLAMV